jgi:hypothetical protein
MTALPVLLPRPPRDWGRAERHRLSSAASDDGPAAAAPAPLDPLPALARAPSESAASPLAGRELPPGDTGLPPSAPSTGLGVIGARSAPASASTAARPPAPTPSPTTTAAADPTLATPARDEGRASDCASTEPVDACTPAPANADDHDAAPEPEPSDAMLPVLCSAECAGDALAAAPCGVSTTDAPSGAAAAGPDSAGGRTATPAPTRTLACTGADANDDAPADDDGRTLRGERETASERARERERERERRHEHTQQRTRAPNNAYTHAQARTHTDAQKSQTAHTHTSQTAHRDKRCALCTQRAEQHASHTHLSTRRRRLARRAVACAPTRSHSRSRSRARVCVRSGGRLRCTRYCGGSGSGGGWLGRRR